MKRRPISVVMLHRTKTSDVEIWVEDDSTYGAIRDHLNAKGFTDVVVLEANFGPIPYWTESSPNSKVSDICQTIYAVSDGRTTPYIVGVVRSSLLDYPVAIFDLPTGSFTVAQAVAAITPKPFEQAVPSVDPKYSKRRNTLNSRPTAYEEEMAAAIQASIIGFPKNEENDLSVINAGPRKRHERILVASVPESVSRSITSILDGNDMRDVEYNYESFKNMGNPCFPTLFFILISEPPTDISVDVPSCIIPQNLQIQYEKCKGLVRRAYNLERFPLQMIHLSTALLFEIISLARALEHNGPDPQQKNFAKGAPLVNSNVIQVTPSIVRDFHGHFANVSAIMTHLESEEVEEINIDKEISLIYQKLCGEYPGAVIIRHLYKKLGEMAVLDYEQRQIMQERNRKEAPTNMQSLKQDSRKTVLFSTTTGTGTSSQQQPNAFSSTENGSEQKPHHSQQQGEALPPFDIKQHPAAISYAASHPGKAIPRFGPYILLQTLGEGEFGKVKLGLHSQSAEEAAVKLIRRRNLESDIRMQKIQREITVLESLHHPNIVRLHETIQTDKYIGVVMDYVSGGELFDHILAHRYLRERDARKLFAQLISAVWYIHQKKIVHRDLKLENLLLDRNHNIIVTDFGFANRFEHKIDDLMQTSCGSPCYAAPELVISEGMYVGSAVDIWSCGVILYAMLAGYLPFDDDPENPEGDNIQKLYRYILNTPLAFPEHVSAEARDLLQKTLVPEPAQRATLQVIMGHSWLQPHANLFSRSVDESERLSKELQEAKKHLYRKKLREREKEQIRQAQYRDYHYIEPSSSSRAARAVFDSTIPRDSEAGDLQHDKPGRRAVASAIVMLSSPPKDNHHPSRDRMAVGEPRYNPLPTKVQDMTIEAGSTLPLQAPQEPKVSPHSQSSKRASGRQTTPTKGNTSPTTAVNIKNNAAFKSTKKTGGYRHTIQLEYDDEGEMEPALSTLPRQSSRSQRAPAVPTPSMPVPPPSSYTPTGQHRSNASPMFQSTPATDLGPGHMEYDASETRSLAIVPLSSSPGNLESNFASEIRKKESQDKNEPVSSSIPKQNRGISADRIVGLGKILTGSVKESSTHPDASVSTPKKRSPSRAERKAGETAVTSVPTDILRDLTSPIGFPNTTVDSSPTTVDIPITPTTPVGNPIADNPMSESNSGSVKVGKRHANKALSLMIEPITKIKEHRSKNRTSAQLGTDDSPKDEWTDHKSKAISTPLSANTEKTTPFPTKPDTTGQEVSEKPRPLVSTPPSAQASSSWRLPLFGDTSVRAKSRISRPPAPVLPLVTPTAEEIDPYNSKAPMTGMASTGATKKSQGVMDWFRKKSLAKERRRAGNTAEISTTIPVAYPDATRIEAHTGGDRAKTPTPMDAEEEVKTPTESSFKKGSERRNTSSVIVSPPAEAFSSGSSHHESFQSSASSLATPSHMDHVLGTIENVTHAPPAVHMLNYSKRSTETGASSGGSLGGSSSGGASYSEIIIRLHDGPVDPSTVSSAPPQEIIIQVLDVLKSLGIEYTRQSEFKYICVRPKKKRAGGKEPSNSRGIAGTTSNRVDKKGQPTPVSTFVAPSKMLKYVMGRSSSQPSSGPDLPPILFVDDARDLGTAAYEMPGEITTKPTIKPIYGEKPDQHDEVRFSVEITRIDRLDDLLSLDIRRLKGNLKSYKFLYDIIRERCNLQR